MPYKQPLWVLCTVSEYECYTPSKEHYGNEVSLNEQNQSLNKEVLWVFVGKRTAKVQAVKVGDMYEKIPATRPESNQWRVARIRVPDDGINHKV